MSGTATLPLNNMGSGVNMTNITTNTITNITTRNIITTTTTTCNLIPDSQDR